MLCSPHAGKKYVGNSAGGCFVPWMAAEKGARVRREDEQREYVCLCTRTAHA
jgi:hypothetical protein